VPSLINPGDYIEILCQIIANAGQLGQVQAGILQTSLRDLYMDAGVLLDEEQIQEDSRWGRVKDEEVPRLDPTWGVYAGQLVADLPPDAAQALAVHRSRRCSLKQWVAALEKLNKDRATPEKIRQSLSSLLVRLSPLTFGQAGRMFGALADDEDAIRVEDLGLPDTPDGRPGFVVLQGGDRLQQFARSFLLGLFAVISYRTAKIRYDKAGGKAPFVTDMFWEEAQKVLTGSAVSSSDGTGVASQAQTIDMFVEMWRDGRRYDNFQHPIVQNLSLLPAGIVPSCNNGFFFRSKEKDDQEAILVYIGKSAKGFVDQRYQRFLSRMPTGYCICKLGRTQDIHEVEPILMRPMIVPMTTPTESALREYFTGLQIVRREKSRADAGDAS
jgi:hypothetical protein